MLLCWSLSTPEGLWCLNSILPLWEGNLRNNSWGGPLKTFDPMFGGLIFKKQVKKKVERIDLSHPNRNYNTDRERGHCCVAVADLESDKVQTLPCHL